MTDAVLQPNDAYQSLCSDFTIYSADGLAFKVHKYKLMAARCVPRRDNASACMTGVARTDTSEAFRSMLSVCHQDKRLTPSQIEHNELRLVDDQIERSHSIRLFLDLIYNRPITPPSSSFNKYLNVGLLLNKYECEGHMQFWRWALRAWSTEDTACTMTLFVCAANLDEVATMVNLIATKSGIWAKRDDKDSDDDTYPVEKYGGLNKVLKTAVTGHLVLDLTSARQDFFEAIPIVYSLALLRASRTVSESGILDKKSRAKVAQEFARIIKA
jgi:hypothetical protein